MSTYVDYKSQVYKSCVCIQETLRHANGKFNSRKHAWNRRNCFSYFKLILDIFPNRPRKMHKTRIYLLWHR